MSPEQTIQSKCIPTCGGENIDDLPPPFGARPMDQILQDLLQERHIIFKLN